MVAHTPRGGTRSGTPPAPPGGPSTPGWALGTPSSATAKRTGGSVVSFHCPGVTDRRDARPSRAESSTLSSPGGRRQLPFRKDTLREGVGEHGAGGHVPPAPADPLWRPVPYLQLHIV